MAFVFILLVALVNVLQVESLLSNSLNATINGLIGPPPCVGNCDSQFDKALVQIQQEDLLTKLITTFPNVPLMKNCSAVFPPNITNPPYLQRVGSTCKWYQNVNGVNTTFLRASYNNYGITYQCDYNPSDVVGTVLSLLPNLNNLQGVNVECLAKYQPTISILLADTIMGCTSLLNDSLSNDLGPGRVSVSIPLQSFEMVISFTDPAKPTLTSQEIPNMASIELIYTCSGPGKSFCQCLTASPIFTAFFKNYLLVVAPCILTKAYALPQVAYC